MRLVIVAGVALTTGALGLGDWPEEGVAERCRLGEDGIDCGLADDPDEGALMQVRKHYESPGGKEKPFHFYPMHFTEYPVPGAVQTHELAMIPSSIPGYDKILVSQISSSHLIEMTCDGNGFCENAISTLIGSRYDGLHGLEPSPYIKGAWGNQVITTLQFGNKLVLVNVSNKPTELNSEWYTPTVDFELSLAIHSVLGPHRPLYLDNDVWITAKTSQNLVRVTNLYKRNIFGVWTNNDPSECQIRVYDVQSSRNAPKAGPIFAQPVFQPGGKKYVYATLDGQGKLARVDPDKGPFFGDAVEFIDLPDDCPIPVGMITDPKSANTLWFTCGASGSPKVGTGTFGRVVDKGWYGQEVTIFKTGSPLAKSAAYLHLAWDKDTTDGFPQLILMSSSIFKGDTMDGLTIATMTKDFRYVRKNSYITNTKQGVWFHRVIPGSGRALYVDGTLSSAVTSFHREDDISFMDTYNPGSDFSGSSGTGVYGLGLPYDHVVYDDPASGDKTPQSKPNSLLEDDSSEEYDKKPYVYFPEHNSQYPVPGAVQTHELAIVPSNKKDHHMVLVSQISNSQLVQMTCDNKGKCEDAIANIVDGQYSGLHGLDRNQYIEGPWGVQLVITLQFLNKVGLLNVSTSSSLSNGFYKPILDWRVSLNVGALQGPHRTVTLDTDVYAGCKTSQDIVKIQDLYRKRKDGTWKVNFGTKQKDLVLYPVQSSLGAPRVGPIFLQPVEHKDGTKFVYGSLDGQGHLARIDPTKAPSEEGAIRFIDVSDQGCPIPVGMVRGPADTAELWFTCGVSGNLKTGTGTFGRIVDQGSDPANMTIFRTDSKYSKQGSYLHLAWTKGTKDGFPQLALLSSSIFNGETLDGESLDGLTTVTFSKDFSQIRKNSYSATLRQGSVNHRVVVFDGDDKDQVIYTDGTADSVVSALYRKGTQSYDAVYNPNTDFTHQPPLELYGQGLPYDRVRYSNVRQ